MAKEWYLLTTPYDQLSGFESEALDDFATEGFSELLDSSIATDVELCNYDLSDCETIRAVVQNNTQDTRLKTLSRLMFVPIGTCKSGMYIKYKNRYWLIVGLVDDNTMYEKAILSLCNYLLTWINTEGKIVQRWANITTASQYNNGETSTSYYFIRSDQVLILTPDDDECLLLNSGKRFIIDKRCKVYENNFSSDTLIDTSKSVATYELTRADSVLYDYQDSGHYEFLASQDEQHKDDGYYVIDGKGYWLCENLKSVNKNTVLSSDIEYDSLDIYNGLDAGIFTAKFYDSDGKQTDISPQWNITSDFSDKLNVEYADSSILISADNNSLINKSFILSLNADGYEETNITITIRAFI